MPEPANATDRLRLVDRALYVALGLGVAARLMHYLADRSVWLDEAMVALNIDQRSFVELAGSLDFNQAAPLGFLWLEKLAVLPFGTSEAALRFWPLVAALGGLVAFAFLARRLCRPRSALFALALFALSASLTYYAAEVKQYSFDVFFACSLPLLALRADGDERSGPWGLLAAAGALAVWFSHPSIFLLPGLALFLWLERPGGATGDPAQSVAAPGARKRRLIGVAALWAVSFGAAYWLTARDVSQSPLMARFWDEGFMPIPPTSAADLAWYVEAFTGWVRGVFDFTETDSPLRTVSFWVAGVLGVVGAALAWRRDRRTLVLVATPIALVLLAAAVRVYPFKGRLIVFLVPSTILLIAWGLEALVAGPERSGGGEGTGTRVRHAPVRVGGGLAVALLVVCSTTVLTGWLADPRREEIRPVLQHVAANSQPGDVVYLHSGAQHATLFYERTCETCRLAGLELRRGGFLAGDEAAVDRDVAGLVGTAGRVWLIFAHEWWGYGDVERARMTRALTSRTAAAAPIDSLIDVGARTYLFDLGSR